MPRAKRTNTRSSRTQGIISGTTVGTWPSGVTLSEGGIEYSSGSFITATELGYLGAPAGPVLAAVSSTSTGLYVTGGSVAWAAGGASVSVNFTDLGITTLYGFSAQHMGSCVSGAFVRCNDTPSGVSMVVVAPEILGGVTVVGGTGGTIYWMAFHS